MACAIVRAYNGSLGASDSCLMLDYVRVIHFCIIIIIITVKMLRELESQSSVVLYILSRGPVRSLAVFLGVLCSLVWSCEVLCGFSKGPVRSFAVFSITPRHCHNCVNEWSLECLLRPQYTDVTKI